MRRSLSAACFAVIFLPGPASAGQATCSNPGLPVGAAASSDVMPWHLTLSLTTAYLRIVNDQTLPEPTGNIDYDAHLSLVETRLTGELAFRPWLALGFAMPYRVVDEHVSFHDPATGAVIMPPAETIHARTETLRGVGDPTLFVHGARELGRVRLHARVGVTVPLGSTVEDPFVLGALGQEHEHIQFGTGTFVPFLALEAQHDVARDVTLVGFALAYPSLYANDKGYQAGTRISGGVSASTGFGLRAWTFSVATEVHEETAETWGGMVHLDEGNGGRVDVFAGGGAAWRPRSDFAVTAELRAPVYSHVVGDQVAYSLTASVGVVGTFDFAPHASWRGLDRRELAQPGEAAPLEPIAGRITVFDLYATWCAPCRRLDDALAELARRYPDRLAVRTLDVVDSSSSAWTRYLAPGHFDLPHVKVYAADGKLAFERTASPEELVQAIEALLQGGIAHVPS